MIKNKTEVLVEDFAKFCKANPELRFWQALRNWSGEDFILTAKYGYPTGHPWDNNTIEDTFYWGDKNN